MNTTTPHGSCHNAGRRAALAGLLAVVAMAAGKISPRYASVKPILETFSEQLPAELKNPDAKKWESWRRDRDKTIRARLDQGDLDSMVNLLLFGTSFTSRPRIRIEQMVEASRSGVLRGRLDDLLGALRATGTDERLVFINQLLRRHGMDLDTQAGYQNRGRFILANLERALTELRDFGQRIEGAKEGEFAERSRLFRDRGVSLDTSLWPALGVEETLKEVKARGLLREAQITRAAVIGPGLDFVDWDSGFDYYPPQTLQPFGLYDSLARLALARTDALRLSVFDISPRVLEHLNRARDRAKKNSNYVVQLPRDPARQWTPEAIEYWRTFGDRIGDSTSPVDPPKVLPGIESRAVRIRPSVVLAVNPVDLNIVLDSEDRYDLIIATNVFVYYDTLEQTLALQNVAAMLKPGGVFLVNSELRELPAIPMKLAGSTRLRYAGAPSVGDRILWYVRQ